MKIIDLFDDLDDKLFLSRYEGIITKPSIIIAISPRTGSTAFSSIINKVKGFAQIEEYFNPRGPIQFFAKDCSRSFGNYLNLINSQYSKDFFVYKTSWQDFQFLSKHSNYKRVFNNPKFIYLDRFDIEAQAISLFLAKKSKKWHFKEKEGGDKLELTLKDFNLKEIMDIIQSVQLEKYNWQEFFYQENINPFNLQYEFISKNMLKAVYNTFDYFNIQEYLKESNELVSDYHKVEKKFYNDWLTKLRKARYV